MAGGGRSAAGTSPFALLAVSAALGARLALGLRLELHHGGDQLLHDSASSQEQGRAFVHFLFLLRDSLPHAETWKLFLDGAPAGSWAAWAHCTDRAACEKHPSTAAFPLTVVPHVPSKWVTDLVSPEVRLLRSATESGAHPRPAMEKFVIMSDSTLPVKPFSVVSRALSRSPDSDFCFNSVDQWARTKIHNKTYVIPKHWQWVVLNRTDALRLIQRWPGPIQDNYAWNVTLPDGSVVPRRLFPLLPNVPDEQIFTLAEGPLEMKTDDPFSEMRQMFGSLRRCRTYLIFNKDMSAYRRIPPWWMPKDDPRIQVSLRVMSDPGTKWDGPPDYTHPVEFTDVGLKTMFALRTSPYLFARKFWGGSTSPQEWAGFFFKL